MNIFAGLALIVIGLVFAAGLSTQKYVDGSCGRGNCVFETHKPKPLPLGFGIVLIGSGLYVASRKSAKRKVREQLEKQTREMASWKREAEQDARRHAGLPPRPEDLHK